MAASQEKLEHVVPEIEGNYGSARWPRYPDCIALPYKFRWSRGSKLLKAGNLRWRRLDLHPRCSNATSPLSRCASSVNRSLSALLPLRRPPCAAT